MADIHSKETGTEWEEAKNSKGGVQYYMNQYGTLPPQVMRWAGIEHTNNSLNTSKGSLMTLNDDGMPFDQIAELIESEY